MPSPTLPYLYVTPFFPSPASWRGAFCLDFVKALMRTGHYDVRVFVPGAGADYEIDGVRVFRFPTRHLPSNVLPFLFRRWNERSFLRKVRAVLGDAISRVAVCHGHTANFAIYSLALKREVPDCKALLHHHDPGSFGLNAGILHRNVFYNAWLFCRLRELHEAIDCHVFVGEASRQSFLAAPDADWTVYEDYKAQMRGPRLFRCRPVRAQRTLVLHNGVDPRLFSRDERPARADGEFAIGSIANFSGWKDQLTLLKAFDRLVREMKDVKTTLTFVGSGESLQECREFVRERGLESCVEFRREVTHEKLPDFYRSLDLFVLPSYFEGFGCVFTEAYACGTPFICCRGQGISELTPDEWMVDPGDVAGLAEKIAWVIRERPEMRLTGEYRIDPLVRRFVEKEI